MSSNSKVVMVTKITEVLCPILKSNLIDFGNFFGIGPGLPLLENLL